MLPTKLDHLDGQGPASASQTRQYLTSIHHNDKAISARSYHLFTKQRTTTSLDELKFWEGHFVGTVNAHIDVRVRRKRCKRDAKRLGLSLRATRCWDANDIPVNDGRECEARRGRL